MHEDDCTGFGRSEVLDFYAKFLERRNCHELKLRFSVPKRLKVLRENQLQSLFVITLQEDGGKFFDDNSRANTSYLGRLCAKNQHVIVHF